GAPYPSLQGTGNILQLSLKYDDLWVDSVVVGETSLEPEDGVYSWELNPTAEPLSIRIYVRHVDLGERPYWIELYSWEQYDEPIDLMVRYKDSEFPDFVEYSQTGSGSMYAFLDTEQLVFEE